MVSTRYLVQRVVASSTLSLDRSFSLVDELTSEQVDKLLATWTRVFSLVDELTSVRVDKLLAT